ncbi:MAG: CDP-glycerol glycerophosphotransferase family protein [Desulfobacterales bacterium]
MIIAGYFATRQTLTAALLWLVVYPLKMVITRDTDLMVVVSSPGLEFADNSKYFFVYAAELVRKGERVVMLTTSRTAQRMISAAGGESIVHPSWRSLFLLLKCGTIIIDFDWFKFGAYPLTHGAKLIQIWHGAPLKHIELDLYRKRLVGMPTWLVALLKIQKTIIGRYPFYDVVVATSQWFITEVFQHCFKAKQFIATGYPRNDILFSWPDPGSISHRLAWINVDRKVLETVSAARTDGHKICLYVPTFRKDMAGPFEKEINLSRLSAFAKKKELLVVLKLHPFMHGQCNIDRYPNLIEYAPLGDVYPLMAHCDLLITDYSSIFFDYLLLDRPIIFFPYDLEQYLSQDRAMYFDYETMTPGPKCRTYDELELQIEKTFKDRHPDEYAEMRMNIRGYTHDHEDNQSHGRLFSSI